MTPLLTPLLIPFPNIDPVLFSFTLFGLNLSIHWYAIAYICGFIIGWRWLLFLTRKPHLWYKNIPPLKGKDIEDLMTWCIIGTILGGRLGYVLFYNSAQYLANPLAALRVWEGGMSFHGGLLGVCLAIILLCKRRGWALLPVCDAVAVCVPFGLFLGRLANFVNAELWGRPTLAPWGVIFPGTSAQSCGQRLGEYCARHPSQLYEAALEGVVLFAVLTFLIFYRGLFKTPGMAMAVFGFGYGISRVIVEAFRQGDAQFVGANNPWGHIIRLGSTADSIGMTMGQILSLPLIFGGLLLMYALQRRR